MLFFLFFSKSLGFHEGKGKSVCLHVVLVLTSSTLLIYLKWFFDLLTLSVIGVPSSKLSLLAAVIVGYSIVKASLVAMQVFDA